MSALAHYPSGTEREARLDQLAGQLDTQVETIGESVEGRPIRALGLGARDDPAAPALLVVANIHGPEFIASQVALGAIAACLDPGSAWEQLTRRTALWVVPCLNPDAYARTYESGGDGPLSELRVNARGVDLNRNFPLPTGARRWPFPGAGSARQGDATYRGSSPGSEPETQALIQLARRVRPHAAVGLHSFMGRVIPARVSDRGEFRRYKELCRAIRKAQPSWSYGRLSSRLFDLFTGEQEDFLHHHLGCWSVCLESYTFLESLKTHLIAPTTFDRFNPIDPQRWVDNDLPAIAAFFEAALEMQRPAHA